MLRILILVLLLTGCSTGAIQFAPTPLPPDLSPAPFEHPSNAFSIEVPRDWSTYIQTTSTLASTSFSPPGQNSPLLTTSVIKIDTPITPDSFSELIDDYQRLHRPDLSRYQEQERIPMSDGSWLISGIRNTVNDTQQINTFIQFQDDLLAVMDVVVDDTSPYWNDLQRAVNTLTLNPETTLESSELSMLGFTRTNKVDVLNTSGWVNPFGVFFVTGEIANNTPDTLTGIAVQVSLLDANSTTLISATDFVMGHGIVPGGFAPFSLRFGAGQPPEATRYTVEVRDSQIADFLIISEPDLTWTDESRFTDENQLVISGTVTNDSSETVQDLLAVITVFDVEQNVTGAWFEPISVNSLAPNESSDFEVRVLELGSEPINYILEIQGLEVP